MAPQRTRTPPYGCSVVFLARTSHLSLAAVSEANRWNNQSADELNQGVDSYQTAAEQYFRKPVLLVRLRDVFAMPNHEPMLLIQPGQFFTTILPNKLPVRVEHHLDGSWLLVIPNIATYSLVAEPMAVPKWRLIWRDGAYHLPSGLRRPVRFYIHDGTGRRVRNLYAVRNKDGSVVVGSRHELKISYQTDSMNHPKRKQRRLTKLFARCPERRADVLNFRNSIYKLMTLRPWIGKSRIRKRDWLRIIVAARYDLRGDELESEVTANLTAYNCRPANRSRYRPQYYRTLLPLNQAAHQVRQWQEEHSEPPPLPLHSGSW
jgi:hypothetical protein